MTVGRLAIGIEGPCCAGKTTLCKGLVEELSCEPLAYIRDYSDFVGGGRNLPSPLPESLDEEEQALYQFLRIEAARFDHAGGDGPKLVLIDRCIHTLLAHCWAVERITGVPHLSLARRVLGTSEIPIWPDIIFYLDISNDVAVTRNRGKFPRESIFLDREFNAGFREYFSELIGAGGPDVVWSNGSRSPEEICLEARWIIFQKKRKVDP